MLIAVVVAHAGHVRDVGYGCRTIGFAILPVAPRHLFGKVHGIAQAAAIAAGVNSASGLLALGNQMSGPRDRLEHILVGNERFKSIFCLCERGANHFFLLAHF